MPLTPAASATPAQPLEVTAPGVNFILSHQAPFVIGGVFLSVITFVLARRVRGGKLFPTEKNFLQLLFGGVAIAQGSALLLLCCYPDAIIKMSDGATYVGIAALCAIYLGILGIRNEVTSDDEPKAP